MTARDKLAELRRLVSAAQGHEDCLCVHCCAFAAAWSPDRALRFVALCEVAERIARAVEPLDEQDAEIWHYLKAALAAALEE